MNPRSGPSIDFKGEESLSPLKDEELVARARKSDQRATEDLVRRYQQKAYAIAYHFTDGNVQDAEDFTQEAFLRAFQNLENFRGDSSFYTWFYRILVNVCLDGRRHRNRWQKIFLPWQRDSTEKGLSPEERPDPEAHERSLKTISGKELSRDIQESLRSLPEKQRLAFQLKALHGMSIQEVARVMGTAEGTVKSHLFRATQFLREKFKDREEG
ncbi:MAG: sigma-70 family RNA polymerase sigma factor [Deltaproteobacteria bacterium]|nr:sigma-70 family RNA polymerase sigma factor [Deltaproteobacteria bacterium]NTV57792.1 sigma-70 family RNA polymerase sigma factor [Deltaproteobacteria bacterium]